MIGLAFSLGYMLFLIIFLFKIRWLASMVLNCICYASFCIEQLPLPIRNNHCNTFLLKIYADGILM